MMPRRVWFALLVAFLCHGLFILTARYQLSYDAYTHMLFADHYAKHWFSLWEARWYTGFTVVSYPPLTHQLIALLIPLVGFDKAFALILWIVTSLYPIGVYVFGRIFTGKASAAYAALAAAVLLPIYVVAHIFGQLPFLTGTLLALFGAASLDRYLRDGGLHNFLLTVSLYTTTMAAHHATLLVQPFLIFAVVVHQLYRHGAVDALCLKNIHVGGIPRLLFRLLPFMFMTALTSFVVIFPFWQWGTGQSIQTPIDHLSRHSVLTEPLAFAIFFLPLYGPFIGLLPFLIRKWPLRLGGLLIAFVTLFLLGLGGTTPLPRLFFGAAWEWLTYDRFAFWACLTLTPCFGILFIWMRHSLRLKTQPRPAALRRDLIPALIFFFCAATALGAWFTPHFFRIQPDPISMQPIVDFLNAGDRSQYRYVTFGFGDQFAHLNLLTQATTIDGSYHTAREIPELRGSGIGQIDTSYWALNGMNTIIPILQKSGEYGVRWGFVNPATLQAVKIRWGELHHSPFIPILEKLGWKRVTTLSNGILVFENPNADIPETVVPPSASPWTAFAWGVLPLFSFVGTLSLGSLRIFPLHAEKVIRALYAFVIGLLPISLCLWFYQPMAEFPHARVYFTYTHALFFLSDGLVCLAVLLWLSVKIVRPTGNFSLGSHSVPLFLLIVLFGLATLSLFWSADWRTSLYIALHFWLMFLLVLSLRDWRATWQVVMFGLCLALSFEIIMGWLGFALQSTAFLAAYPLNWPGSLEPTLRGASVVQLADGFRVLRAYGTLPHPNILGGLTFFTLLAPASLYLEKRNQPALLLLSFGVILLVLTFSRSAWLGLVAFVIILILKSKVFESRRLILFVTVCVLAIALALYPLRDLVFIRISNAAVATEQLSTFGREWLTQQAFNIFQHHPWTGIGVGSFVIDLSKYAIDGAIIEPVHNMFLLVGAELGLFGLLLLTSIFFLILFGIYKSHSPKAILVGATLTGLGVISLFDHYLWTLAPGRTLLALALSLWFGQYKDES